MSKCPLRGSDCRADCAWVAEDICAVLAIDARLEMISRALGALVKAMEAK